MAHVVTETCLNCKYTDCVEVCPVDCFHEAPLTLYIDPEVCIDCMLCVPECPVQAIFQDYDVPAAQHHCIALNAEEATKYPVITQKQAPLPTAPPRE